MNKRIQYYHEIHSYRNGIKREFTAVCRVPTNEQLLEFLQQRFIDPTAFIYISFGIAKVHPKDQYCYKIGREEALKKDSLHRFEALNISFVSDGSIQYRFYGANHHSITIETTPTRKIPYLINVYANNTN